jgi:Tfp pilus assembly protein PilO
MIQTVADTASDAHSWSIDGMVWTFGSLIVSLLFVAVAAWYAVARSRAKAALSKESSYRELADDATDAKYQTSAKLADIGKQLAEMSGRLTSMERLLREVE